MISWEKASKNWLHCSSNLSVESRPIPLSWQETLSRSIRLRHISWAETYQWPCCNDHVDAKDSIQPLLFQSRTPFERTTRHKKWVPTKVMKNLYSTSCSDKIDVNFLRSYRNLGWLRLLWLWAVQPPPKNTWHLKLMISNRVVLFVFQVSHQNSSRKAFPKLSQRAMN